MLKVLISKIIWWYDENEEPRAISVDSNWKLSTKLVDSNWKELLLESNWWLPINIQDQTSDIVDVFFCNTLNTVTLAWTVIIDTNTATLLPWHWFVVWNMFCLKEWTRFFQAQIINVATNIITIDRPFDFAFTTNAITTRTSKEMNVDWSVTPVIFKVTPVWTNMKFDICKLIFHIEDNVAMDDSKFWWITELTKWIVLRKKDWVYKSIFNSKSNWDFAHHCSDIQYADHAPSGEYWFRAIKRFAWPENHWVVIRLDPALNDELQVIIQDNLIWLTEFHCIALWHVVTD